MLPEEGIYVVIIVLLATLMAYRSSGARDRTHTTSATQATSATMSDATEPHGNSKEGLLYSLTLESSMAHGGSQARGLIRVVATGLRHSHSNARSKPRLRPTPQLMAMSDP